MKKYNGYIYFSTTGLKSPCTKECPDRIAGCVSTCDKLKEYESKKREAYEARGRIMDKQRDLDEVRYRK